MTNEISVIYTDDDDELYCQYSGQSGPQPALLCLNLDDGEVSASYRANIGGQSMRAFHNRDIEWEIPTFRVDAFRRFIDSVRDDLQTIFDGATVEWNGNNYVGRLDDDARDAADRIEDACNDAMAQADPTDVWSPWEAADWFAPTSLDELGLSPASTDDEIEQVADREIKTADAVLDRDDVIDYLREQRDEALSDLDDEIEELRDEAARVGDVDQVAICDRALDGDEAARVECARVIAHAAAQIDDDTCNGCMWLVDGRCNTVGNCGNNGDEAGGSRCPSYEAAE